ncbi:MAG TPA: response regulator [Polyangiaceae bacterium]|nr:response regulator [Polyangiaceae bacterium]
MTHAWHGLPVGRRVLLAEDDVALSEMLALVLSESGYQVTTVGDGAGLTHALRERSERGRFDLIVTDMNMPGSSGLDVVDWLRTDGDFTPVILIAAFPEDDIRKRAGALGLRLLAKPFELEALRAAVDWAIRAHAPHPWRLTSPP